MIRYKCEKCSSVLKIKDRLAGTAGKCPKCRTKFQVPEPDSAEPESSEQDDEQQELSEEEAIFGRDFFKPQDGSNVRRPAAPAAPAYDAGTSQPSPVMPEVPAEPTAPEPFSAARPTTVDNSSNIAGDLLSKTGKKNRPDDWSDPADSDAGYDFTAINYLVLYRVLPALVTFLLMYWGFSAITSDIAGTGVDLPPLALVTGNISLDGRPSAGILSFQPEPEQGEQKAGGASSMGTAANDGNYSLNYKADVEGALIGKHVVIISIGAQRFKEEATVTEGENQIDFKLVTPVGQPQR